MDDLEICSLSIKLPIVFVLFHSFLQNHVSSIHWKIISITLQLVDYKFFKFKKVSLRREDQDVSKLYG